MHEIEVVPVLVPNKAKWPHTAAAFASFRYTTGLPNTLERLPHISKLAQSECTKFVDPFALSTPVALAGPGVSRPTTATSASETPAFSTAILRPSAICLRQTAGPSVERLGCSHMPSIRNSSRSVSNV